MTVAKPQTVFDTDDKARVVHERVGLWDLYIQETAPESSWSWPGVSTWRRVQELWKNFAYIRALFTILASEPWEFGVNVLLMLLGNVGFPTFSLWLSTQLLEVMTAAIDNRLPEQKWFIFLLVCKPVMNVLESIVRNIHSYQDEAVVKRLQRYFTRRMITARSRLDVPTFSDATVAGQLQAADGEGSTQPHEALRTTIYYAVSGILSLTGSLIVLTIVVWNNAVVFKLVLAGFIPPIISTLDTLTWWNASSSAIWAATCKDKRYIKWRGLNATVLGEKHKQEIVAGNLDPYINHESDRLVEELGNNAVTDFNRAEYREWAWKRDRFSFRNLYRGFLDDLPKLILAFLVVNAPSEMPLLLASYTVIEQATNTVISELWSMAGLGKNLANSLNDLKALFEIVTVGNKVVDGHVPYPENAQDTASNGIEIEFRGVSFKYPGTEVYALRDVSFTIQRGQLAVIVGFNGSGKSTILKLITRIFDPSEGQIFIDGRDIKTLKLFDLRETIACLFQDYSILPLSIGLNIGLGWPACAEDGDAVKRAAKLAEIDFQERLGEGFDSYLEHPVQDHYANLPEGTTTIFGQKVDFKGVRHRMSASRNTSLSGGQTQKIAVARALMRTTCGNDHVGLMLFDEPSAHMDPVVLLIRHEALFQTLRELRGNKTMIFSSHRYGNLTRHAGVIFYMKDGRILERGTHGELMAAGGGYAEMWKLQAAAFVS
ncbi:P-loop containing nucleoside triphosphate hydrolase protein [Exidia glandulosa HHB12029]|uniref:p-loop containing nucleoside triphosphate hydrolase protein n=1 Tax=Exidia glandulosa HHB12029 TaxID=1314781 RepID=A0A165PNW2_EXIGL|nr:P-loop containing nucleoside triphosphate hydrolase protein [Exidia glandulosa HHB12029]